MFNSLKTVAQLLAETPSVRTFLQDAEKYYAHIPPKNAQEPKQPETLAQHIELVQAKFQKLSEVHGLDAVLDALIIDFIQANEIDLPTQPKVAGFVKRLFVGTIIFHDYGKINENFQADDSKMNNPNFETVENHLGTHHSALGAYLYIAKHFQEVMQEFANSQVAQSCLLPVIVGFSYTIFRHHAKFLNDADNIKQKISFSLAELNSMQNYIQKYGFQIDKRISQIFFEDSIQIAGKKNIVVQFEKLDNKLVHFSFYSLVRLSFSLLTASDFLASGEYMSGIEITDFGTLSRDRIAQIFQNVQKCKDYNRATYEKLEGYQFQKPTLPTNENLNTLRQEMAIEVIQNIHKNKDANLFYIEAPTGGGKTNLSMLATAELLQSDERLNKVYYVFPFTTLVTQTHKAIIETLGLEAHEVVQLHSKAGFPTKEREEENKDGVYSSEKLNYLDRLFVNYPFCLLTHIKFFDILKTNEKESNYLLSRLANSVVVIDELQSYNPAHWDKVIYWIRQYAHYYNIKFILMSATLPKLDKLKLAKDQAHDFVYLLTNAKKDYFQNPNFAQRVAFQFDLLAQKKLSLEQLADTLLEKSRAFAEIEAGKAKPKGSVYTIVEFIFKRAATDFYNVIRAKGNFFDEIFVLSGTILEHRRKYIINYLKNPANRTKKILLITTQVVEAGVDIDMDLGFKNASLIDSDEQLAGRINRNVNKENCELYVFKYNEPNVLYASDKRYKFTKERLKQEDYEQILQTKDFDRLYDLVLGFIQEYNDTDKIHNQLVRFEDYENTIKRLDFYQTNKKFRLIEQENLSVFVPMAIPVCVAGAEACKEEAVFTKSELDFLAKFQILPTAGKIEGEQVFNLYVDLTENRLPDFIAHKVSLQILQGIISKFVFSLFDDAYGRTRKKLVEFSDLGKKKKPNPNPNPKDDDTAYGYIYLAHYAQVYNEVFGLDDASFDKTENCIL